jgi:hypothetical protein
MSPLLNTKDRFSEAVELLAVARELIRDAIDLLDAASKPPSMKCNCVPGRGQNLTDLSEHDEDCVKRRML